MTESQGQKIKKIFLNHLFEPDAQISILEQLNSLELVHLVTELEKAFGISISALEINDDSFGSLDKLSSFISQKKAHR